MDDKYNSIASLAVLGLVGVLPSVFSDSGGVVLLFSFGGVKHALSVNATTNMKTVSKIKFFFMDLPYASDKFFNPSVAHCEQFFKYFFGCLNVTCRVVMEELDVQSLAQNVQL